MNLSQSVKELSEACENSRANFSTAEELDDYLAYLFEDAGLSKEGASAEFLARSVHRISNGLESYKENPAIRSKRMADSISFGVACIGSIALLVALPLPQTKSFSDTVFYWPLVLAILWLSFCLFYKASEWLVLNSLRDRDNRNDPYFRLAPRQKTNFFQAVPFFRSLLTSLWVGITCIAWFFFYWLASDTGRESPFALTLLGRILLWGPIPFICILGTPFLSIQLYKKAHDRLTRASHS